MENFFLQLLNMSLTAGVLVVVVMLLRLVFHKAPRWIHCLLWALVAVRLLCPVSIESSLSLMPDTPALSVSVPDTPSVAPVVPDQSVVTPPVTDTPVVDTPVVTPPVTDTPTVTPTPDTSVSAPTPEASADPWQIALAVASYAWLAGMAVMAAYAVFSTLRLRRQVGEAAHLRANLWQCDHIRSPFILGVIRPRIYLPSDLSGTALDSVVSHEQAHLHRRDHWWKPLGFLLLTVYWFNPLMWVAYIFLCRDIEAACDERVVRHMSADARRAYSEALLSCSAPRRLVSACPLAFGETSVKSRIKSVLSYKKPTIWIIVAALLVSTVAGVCLLTDPKSETPDTDTTAVSEEQQPDEDDTPDKTDDATAPVGLTYVTKAHYVSGQEREAMMGSESVKRFDTRVDFETFLTTYQKTEDGGTRWEISDFDQFDTAFFAENALLMTFRQTSSGMYTPQVGGYTYSEDGTILSVIVDELHPGGMVTMDIGHWLLFSGIRKADLEGVTALMSYFGKEILTSYCWTTYGHPVIVGDEEDVAFGCYNIYYDSLSTLLPLVKGLNWYGADIMADTAFTTIASFIFDDGKTYYVSPDKKQLYDGEQIADLTAEQSEQLDYYLREGSPIDAATVSVTGMVAEWNKAEQYLVLDVTEGDASLGSRVRAYTTILPAGSSPAVGYSATVYYDGWYLSEGEYSVIYALNREWMDADLLGGPEDDEPTNSTTTTTPSTTTTTTTVPTQPTIPTSAEVGDVLVLGGMGMWNDGVLEEVYGGESVRVFRSYAELDAFLNQYAVNDRYLKREDFAQFTADWFAENALLMTYYVDGSCSVHPTIGAYSYNEDGTVLSVGIDVYEPLMQNDAIGGWHMFSGIKQDALAGVEELTAYVRAEIPEHYYIAPFVTPVEHPEKGVEKWRDWFPSEEGWTWSKILNEMDEQNRWVDAASVDRAFLYVATFQENGHIHYVDEDYSSLLRDDGKLLWMTEKESGLLQWMIASKSRDNTDIWFVRFSHPGGGFDYADTPVVMNTPELRAILGRKNWLVNTGRHQIDACMTVGGVEYYVDWEHKQILYTESLDTMRVLYLTKEEQAYLADLICDPKWKSDVKLTGTVVEYDEQKGYFTVQPYVSSLGKAVRVSLIYWSGDVPEVGSNVIVGYDGYVYHISPPMVYARSIIKG